MHGHRRSPGREHRRRVERVRERRYRQRKLEAAGVEAEGDLAYAVEREAAEDVLEIQQPLAPVAGGRAKQRDEAAPQFRGHDVRREGSYRRRGELSRGELALEEPAVAVDVEYAAAEEVGEDGREGGTLGVVVEAAAQHVVDGGRVGGEHVPEHVHVHGSPRRAAQQVRVPVAEVVELARPRRGHVRLAHRARAPPRRPQPLQSQQQREGHRARGRDEEDGGNLRLQGAR
ncbi:Os05g0445000 [Oryza sativa Japonica Group]|uniref:Os05g0445000 protein n=2 Tax=Oryza sativa subsp. japonica TaxID=39947 RepID=Q0DHS7_ORYSJ|nr:unknown protein [Oryza sativa Japonica Group]KAB8099642.1 hypothetical protein EE612_029809 [Oryza sativa]BAF17596.1 Os05g0445000 [Oryza sativa Japonica Group]BAS94274.1 Os05g0445000 [Oryza sativa Japonica Group]|eukprot:NP_001055682.1 Os05g0445000 [Oryza sativa Japonica Group]